MNKIQINNLVFRPQEFNGRFKLSNPVGQYHYRPRLKWNLGNYLQHVLGVLHYRSSHAPNPVRKKWKLVANRFVIKHKKIV